MNNRKLELQNKWLLKLLTWVFRIYISKSVDLYNGHPPQWAQAYQDQQNTLRKSQDVLSTRLNSFNKKR